MAARRKYWRGKMFSPDTNMLLKRYRIKEKWIERRWGKLQWRERRAIADRLTPQYAS